MKTKIGIAGSGTNGTDEVLRKSAEIGAELARLDCILLTGSGFGLPHEAAKASKKAGGSVIGISPASGIKEHVERYNFPTDSFDALIFSGFGLKGRNVLFIRSCDGVIIISGGIGTLNEFTIAYDEGKAIGVLKGTGGICDSIDGIEKLVEKSGKKGGLIIYDSDPKILVNKLVAICDAQRVKRDT